MTNTLMFVTDDMRYDCSFYMPTLSRLKRLGTTFINTRQSIGLCQPARVGFMTGQLGKHHGVFDNNDYDLDNVDYDFDNTIAAWLNDDGIYTGLIGKYLNDRGMLNDERPVGDGWDFWRQLVHNAAGKLGWAHGYSIYNGSPGGVSTPSDYHLDYYYTQVQDFLAAATEPWFLYVAPTNPHDPMHPRPQHNHIWSHAKHSIIEETSLNLRAHWVQLRNALDTDDRNAIRQLFRRQLRECSGADAFLASILDLIDMSDTDVIFTNDNSIHYGEVLLKAVTGPAKNTPYDYGSLRVPLICAGPSFPENNIVTPQTTNIDITSTICAIQGVTPGLTDVTGEDLTDVAVNPINYDDRELLIQGRTDPLGDPFSIPQDQPSFDAISTSTRKLIRYHTNHFCFDINFPEDEFELYALDTDPHEVVNLANSGANDPETGNPWTATRDAMETDLIAALA